MSFVIRLFSWFGAFLLDRCVDHEDARLPVIPEQGARWKKDRTLRDSAKQHNVCGHPDAKFSVRMRNGDNDAIGCDSIGDSRLKRNAADRAGEDLRLKGVYGELRDLSD